MENSIKNILRWIAVLPSSVIGSFIIYALFVWMNRVSERSLFFTNLDWLWNGAIAFIGQAIFGAAFVGIGVYVAPGYKKLCSIVLFILISLFSGYTLLTNIINSEYADAFRCAFTFIGAGYVLYVVKEND